MNIGAQIGEFVSVNVNIVIIIILMGIGAGIKHIQKFKNISNQYIPIILILAGIICAFINAPIIAKITILEILASGIINAAVAIGFHQSGKTIFDVIGTNNNIEE